MWKSIASASLLAGRVPVYRTVMALVPPILPTQAEWYPFWAEHLARHKSSNGDESSLQFSFAVSDPYISAVTTFGIAKIGTRSDLAALFTSHRVGALLLSAHPAYVPLSLPENLHRSWDTANELLATGEPSTSHSLEASCFSMPATASGWRPPTHSAVEHSEAELWHRSVDTPEEPGGGAAALQLQCWLDDVQGGWPNSFG